MKIAGILHVINHLDDPTEHLIEQESIHAAKLISELFWQHTSLALDISDENQVEEDTAYLLNKLATFEGIATTQRQLFERCKGRLRNTRRLAVALERLDRLKVITLHTRMTRGGQSIEIRVNREELENVVRNVRKVKMLPID